jgi:hypothetical protein
VPKGRGYAAIRIPFVSRKATGPTVTEDPERLELLGLEQDCLSDLRAYDIGDVSIERVLSTLARFDRILGYGPELHGLYKKTLEDKPWKSCGCPICRDLGIEVVVFRGNNRNRRRGFHNTYVFHNVVKDPKFWLDFMHQKQEPPVLLAVNKGDRVLVITECSKKKIGYTDHTKRVADEMYQGRLFKWVRRYCKAMEFDYVIVSAKYGLVFPNETIGGYEKVLKTREDVETIRSQIEQRLKNIISNYDRIVVIAGERYRMTLRNLWDDRFSIVKSRGYGDMCKILENATPLPKSLSEFVS